MNEQPNDYDSLSPAEGSTGSSAKNHSAKTVIYPLGKYEITVQLDDQSRFIGITEIKINKDFISAMQKTVIKGYHDVAKFYEGE